MGREMRGLDGEGRRGREKEGACGNAGGRRLNEEAVTATKKRHGARRAPWRRRQAAAETSVETEEMVFRIWEAIW